MHVFGYMEEAALMGNLWPDLRDHRWIQTAFIRHELARGDALGFQLLEKGFQVRGLQVIHDHLRGQKGRWAVRVHRQENGFVPLIHLIDAQHAAEGVVLGCG
ncbi:hypothetical protein [Deinococcus multiflagellatus]|uniref:Uncharacterized protein n=1 Tax=Deinococcus multiflagellatus TaxID=1656887 RepID=A0ABW1ZF37_9DEIO